METIIKISTLGALWVIIVFASMVLAQERLDKVAETKIKIFLETSQELRDYSNHGFTSLFSGNFRPIPNDIQTELNKNLPEYNFYVAEMTVLIDFLPRKYNLILIFDISTTEVKGFVWGDYWMLPPSKSFSSILKGFRVKSREEAINRVRALASLIVSASHDNVGTVGNAKIKKGKVKVEMIRGGGVFAVLEAKINSSLQFGSLSITMVA